MEDGASKLNKLRKQIVLIEDEAMRRVLQEMIAEEELLEALSRLDRGASWVPPPDTKAS